MRRIILIRVLLIIVVAFHLTIFGAVEGRTTGVRRVLTAGRLPYHNNMRNIPRTRKLHQEETHSRLKNMNLNRVFALDKLHLWLVGGTFTAKRGESDILVSADGGISWRKQFSSTEIWLFDVKFLNANIGFAVGWDNNRKGVILKSTDSGAHWQRVSPDVDALLCESQFLGTEHGWVLSADGQILRTSDGGAHWQVYQIAATKGLTSVSRSDRQNGWVVGDDGQAYQSTDGGVTWVSRGEELRRLVNTPRPVKETSFRQVTFISPEIGFIAAQMLVPRDTEQGETTYDYKGIVYRTQDGGQTWVPQIATETQGLLSAQFINKHEAWVVPTWKSAEGNLLRFTQEGLRRVSTGDRAGETPLSIFFVDAQNGWLITSLGMNFSRLYHTTDGGETWSKLL